jgi:hypothetical protein
MDADTSKSLPAIGFLTVLESADHGVFGGYLVLSPHGRPLEFRCSTPVAASRAQQILYGASLRPYLLAEVIGQTLLAGAELPVRLVLTDQRDMLPLAGLRSEPLVLIEQPASTDAENFDASLDFAGCLLTASPGVAITGFAAILQTFSAHIDLCEPFERIRAALVEAQLAPYDGGEARDERVRAA